MIYFGVDLYPTSFSVAALTEGFAFLDKKFFSFDKHDEFKLWINNCKQDPDEICSWFFDESKFNILNDIDGPFPFNYEDRNNSDYIYLVNHRKLSNIMQFLYEWIIHQHDFFLELDKAYVLASSIRIFDDLDMISKSDYISG